VKIVFLALGQKDETVVAALWKLGITPNSLLTIADLEDHKIVILLDGLPIDIPLEIAQKTLVMEVS
jgi:hypothetical protein